MVIDMLPEFVQEQIIDIRPGIVDQAVYRLSVVDESRDWETGMEDDCNLAFVKID